MSVVISLGAKPAQAEEGGIELHMDLALLHSCTSVSLVTGLSCALDHSSNDFALAQVVPQNRVAFDKREERETETERERETERDREREREREKETSRERQRERQRQTTISKRNVSFDLLNEANT